MDAQQVIERLLDAVTNGRAQFVAFGWLCLVVGTVVEHRRGTAERRKR